MSVATHPEVADMFARRTLHLGRRLGVHPSVETLNEIRAHLEALRAFSERVQAERWYAPHFARWVGDFVAVLDAADRRFREAPTSPSFLVVMEHHLSSSLFDYRLCSYTCAAELGMPRRKTEVLRAKEG